MTKMIAPLPPDSPTILFIVGVERSGTTLLRTVLHAHPRIWVGYECGFHRRLFDRHADGIDCAQGLEAFLNDLFAVTRFKHWGLSRDRIADALLSAGQDVLPYRDAIYRIAQAVRDANRPEGTWVGFKYPNDIYHIDFLFGLFPQARVVHIIRDPRAVMASEKAKRIKLGRYDRTETIFAVARRYRHMAQERARWRGDNRYLEVSYENLIGDFSNSMTKLLAALGLDLAPEVLEYHRLAREFRFTPESDLWQHPLTLAPPDLSRLTAYRDELDRHERAGIELLCRRDLHEIHGVEIEPRLIGDAIRRLRLFGGRVRNRVFRAANAPRAIQ
jgi:hypothetical protein